MDTRASTTSVENDNNPPTSATETSSDQQGSSPTPPSNSESTNANNEVPSSIATLDANANDNTPISRRRRGHRAASSVWAVLTLDPSPHLAIASVCRHCKTRVPHHHKSEKARAHLLRCSAFRQAMADADARGDPEFPHPEWFPDASTNRIRSRGSIDGQVSSDELLSRNASNKRQRLTTATTVSVSLVDPITVMDALAMYIYTTGSRFVHIENPHLRRAVDLAASASSPLLPAFGATDLTGAALDRAFAAVQCELLRVTQREDTVNALCVNSWVPSTRESVYLVGSVNETPLFIDTTPIVDDPAAAASAHVLFDRLARALTLCGDNIHGIVTDNSHANQLTWAKFKSIFPAKFFHGCAAHGLYLFVEEIFGTTTETTTAFADLRRLVKECREIVTFFNGDDVAVDVKASISAKLSDARASKLEMPLPDQWFELKAGFESILVVLPVLQELTTSAVFLETGNKPQRHRIAWLVNQSELETLLFKAVALVDPLDTLMKRLEREPATPLSDVFYWFAKELPVALSRVPGLSEEEATFLLKLNQNRFNAMYGDSHGMAYLLDPRYVGEGLSVDVRKNIEDLIFNAPVVEVTSKDVNIDEQKIEIAQQLTEYVIDATKEKTGNSFRYSILEKNKKSVLQYWLSDGLRWPLLQRLAKRLFSLPASTLPMTKRVLSVAVHLPNEELTPEQVKKIKFIQLNQALLNTTTMDTMDGAT